MKKRWLVVKIAFTLAALGFILSVFSGSSIKQLYVSDYGAIFAAILLIFGNFLVNAIRWRLILKAAGKPIPFQKSLRLVLIGQFFNQTLPSAVGGDAFRAWHVWRDGVPAETALASVLADRASGVLAMTLLSLATLSLTPPIGDRHVMILIGLVLCGALCGFAGVFVLTRLPARLVARLRLTTVSGASRLLTRTLFASREAIAILAASLVMALLNCGGVAMIGSALGTPLSIGATFLAVPITLLASAVPISIGGWGVREGAMVLMLGLYGIKPVAALAISVLLGLLMILCGLPGGVAWLVSGREQAGTLTTTPAVSDL